MQKGTFPRAVSGRQKQSRRAATSGAVRGTASRRRPQSQPSPTDSREEAPDVEIEGDGLQMAVIEKQIDNIHLELDTQMSRTAQLETLLIVIKDELHELIEMVKWLQDEVLNKPARIVDISRKVLH
jgi:hypothetical protein